VFLFVLSYSLDLGGMGRQRGQHSMTPVSNCCLLGQLSTGHAFLVHVMVPFLSHTHVTHGASIGRISMLTLMLWPRSSQANNVNNKNHTQFLARKNHNS
jgi:hypothetical protein